MIIQFVCNALSRLPRMSNGAWTKPLMLRSRLLEKRVRTNFSWNAPLLMCRGNKNWMLWFSGLILIVVFNCLLLNATLLYLVQLLLNRFIF